MEQIYFNKLNLICGFLILLCINAFAQPSAIKEVRPMTPDIAALFKLTDRPVGSFTGTAPVSFPLMTVTSGPLSVNLSLDYSTSGIRVEEVASSVGLGFSFNDGGGRIVQIVNGKPDDQTGGLLDIFQSVKPSNFSCSNYNHLLSVYANQLDLEPDIFMYNFAGKSGSFSFQENGDIINKNDNGLKIERISKGFKVTDGEGIQYYFTTVSQNTYSYGGGGGTYTPSPIKSSNWYLTDIYDINNENQIKFTYVNSGGSFYGFSSGYMSIGIIYCPDYQGEYTESYVGTTSNEMVLAKVEGGSGYVLCNSSNDRLDMTSARKINSLEAYDVTGALKKKYKFNYSYSSGAGSNSRLKLNNFSEFGTNLADSLVYKFDYEPVGLPAYNSKAIDFWGYSNGKYNNSSHFSDLVYKSGNVIVRQMSNEVDRTPDPFYAKAQSLSKITYPSGGYRQFIYEGNTISEYVNFNEFVPDPDVANAQKFSITNFSGGGSVGTYAQKFFTVNSTYGGAYFKVMIGSSSPTNNIRIYKANPGNTSGGTEVYGQSQMNVYKWDLPNGNYRLDVNSLSVTNLNATWSECTVAEGSYYNKEVGGIRIKEIRDYDPVSNKTNTTKYLYKQYSKDSTITSGKPVIPLRVTEYEYSRPQCTYRRLNATGNYPLTTDGGSYVVYPEVRTIEEGNGWNDRIYRYAKDYILGGNPAPPIISRSDYRGQLESEKIYSQSGVLLKRTVSDYQDMSSGLSQLGIRVRLIFGIDNPGGGQKATFSPQPGYPTPSSGWCTNWYAQYGKQALSYTIDSVFNANGANVNRTDYKYEDNGKYFLPKQVKTTNSNGTTREVNYRYASTPNTEFALGLTADEQAMKTTLFSKNYLQPLEITNTITTSGGTADLVNGKKMIFNNFNGTKSRLSSVKEYSSMSDFRETFLSSYDDKGNLVEKYINPSLREVYLWGYNAQYPVAKIVSSDYTTVSSIISQSQIDVATSIPANEEGLRSLLNNLRSNLPNSQVWTYTYNPLVGLTSETDAKGMTTFYEYDEFKRLKNVKDQNGNIIKNNIYHYKP